MARRKAKTILFLAANPVDTVPLCVGKESREIDERLRRGRQRESFQFEQRLAVCAEDLQQALLDFRPQIVHFAGHGAGEQGLLLEDEDGTAKPVSADALASLFKLYSKRVECVLLNACYSEAHAAAVAQHIPYVIGMNQEIGDETALKFATAFYSALAAGDGFDFAFESGRAAIMLAGIPEHLVPVLNVRNAAPIGTPATAAEPHRRSRRAFRKPVRRSDAFNLVTGTIKTPAKDQLVPPSFRCCGEVSGMDPTLSLWLAVEVGRRVWPKENKPVVDRHGRWSATVFEDGASDQFAIGLYLGGPGVDERISKWLDRGRSTGKYREMTGIRGARRLDRVDKLRLERGDATQG